MSEAVFPPCHLPGPNYGGGNEDTGDLPQKIPCVYCYSPCPQPCIRPAQTHACTGDSRTPTGKSGTVSCGVTALFSWVFSPGCTRFYCALQESISQSCVSSGSSMVGLMVTSNKRTYAISPQWTYGLNGHEFE